MSYPFVTTNKSYYFSRSGDVAFHSCDHFLIKAKILLEKHKSDNNQNKIISQDLPLITQKDEIENPFCIKIHNKNNRFTIALVLSRKVGNAVLRNKMKRRLRIIVSNLKNIDSNQVLIFIARPKISELSFKQLNEQINFAICRIQKRINFTKQ